jgi:hypothetical protein
MHGPTCIFFCSVWANRTPLSLLRAFHNADDDAVKDEGYQRASHTVIALEPMVCNRGSAARGAIKGFFFFLTPLSIFLPPDVRFCLVSFGGHRPSFSSF